MSTITYQSCDPLTEFLCHFLYSCILKEEKSYTLEFEKAYGLLSVTLT